MAEFALADTLRFLAALLLPWAAGRACLQPVLRRSCLSATAALGYGFFLGAALLYVILLLVDALIGAHSFFATALLLLLAGAGALVAGSGGRPSPDTAVTSAATPAAGATSAPGRINIALIALIALSVLLAAHAGWIAVEAGWLPTFPWDAWQTWLYKARAWFYAGAIVPVAEPEAWLANPALPFNAPGGRYPGLMPAYSFWVTSALGDWQDGAAHAPTLLAGLALLLALGGQGAAATGRRLPGLIAAYGFLSIPLVGTHLALAGYADLWLAGFSGLGMIALLRSLQQPRVHQGGLGLLFLLLGLLVKHDALVWCALGAGLWLACRRPRRLGLGVLAAAALLGLGLLFGVHALAIPGFGTVGIENHVLYLGPFASLPLSLNAVADDYLRHLLINDSWHLLWYALPAAAIAAAWQPALRPLRRPLLLYLLLLGGSQAIIFGGTAAGAWAEDGTALNRLLLQQAPVLVFLLVLAGDRLSGSQTRASAGRTLLAAGLGTAAVGAGIGSWLSWQAGPEVARAPVPLRAVVGQAVPDAGALRITAFRDGLAVLSSGPVAVDAEARPILDLGRALPAGANAALFWRRDQASGELHSRRLLSDHRRLDLRGEPEWRGRIAELGVVAYAGSEEPLRIATPTLAPATAGERARMLRDHWLAARSWTQADINARRAFKDRLPAPVPTMAAWLGIAALAALLIGGRRGGRTRGTLLALGMIAWLTLDSRWLVQGILNAERTLDRYAAAGDRDAAAGATPALPLPGDRDLLNFAREVRGALGAATERVIIAAEDPRMRFELQRMRYHLLPQRAYAHEGPLAAAPVAPGQPLVVLRRRAASKLQSTDPGLEGRQVRLSSPAGLLLE